MSLAAPLLAAILGLSTPQVSATPYCALAAETSLRQPVESFEDGPTGWRRWDEGGCGKAAADLIEAYRAANSATLRSDEQVMLSFHEAQLRASDGDYPKALVLLESIDGKAASRATEFYFDATRAFLKGDAAALAEARDRLAALPPPPGFERARAEFIARHGGDGPEWPLNIGVVNDLIRCFGEPYSVAYSCPAQS